MEVLSEAQSLQIYP